MAELAKKKSELEPEEQPASKAKSSSNTKPTVAPEPTEVPKLAASAKPVSTPKPRSKAPSGMRKAAPRLSDREKLKQELEAGKKEQPSVL